MTSQATVRCECGRDVPIDPPMINGDVQLICDHLHAENERLKLDNERLRQLWIPIESDEA